MANRRDEAPKTWFRSDRVFRVDGEWFIHTREGIAVGPYQDKFAAGVDAELLKSLLVGVEESEAVGIIRWFMGRDGTDVSTTASARSRGQLAADEFFSFDQIRQLS